MTAARYSRIALSTLVIAAAACGGGSGGDATTTPGGTPAATKSDAPAPTGKVITVEMYTYEQGNYFKPNKIEAHRGDVVRFVLKTGVHNVNFLPDSNPGKTGLPKVSDFLQLPGQEYDVPVNFAPGHYYFQCDPHALLGMVGRLEVEDERD
jgi:plastocyanin